MSNLKNILMTPDAEVILTRMHQAGTLAVLEPTLADLEMEIPVGCHHKNNLTHSLKVLGQAIERERNGADLILRTAALFHDIGKPATRKFRGKKTVTFDGHEVVGANMVHKILKNHGYSKEEIQQISHLIALHMRSHGFEHADWTDSATRRLISDAGNPVALERLVIIFYADTTTSNAKTRRAIYESLDALVQEIERVQAADARKALRPALSGHDIMEQYNLTQGVQLGKIMKFLNSDEGVHLSVDEAHDVIQSRFLV